MLVDAVGLRPDTELAHRRLCDVVWSTERAPMDSPDVLQDVCRVKAQDWMRVRGELESKGWYSENGLFTHKRCMETLSRCRDKYLQKVAASKAGNDAKRAKNNPTGQPTGQPTGIKPEIRPDNRLASQSQSQSPLHTHTPDANIPTWEEIKTKASMTAIPEASA